MLAKYISVLTNYDVLDSSSNKLKTTDLMNVSTATYVYDNGSLKNQTKALLRLTARQDISRSQTVSMTMTAQTDLLSLLSIIPTQREAVKLLLDFIFLFL